MTRNEALKKLEKHCGLDSVSAKYQLSVFEALELIKFNNEPKAKPSPSSIMALHLTEHDTPHIDADKIVNELMKYNYRIVDADKCWVVDKDKRFRFETIDLAVYTVNDKFIGQVD